MKIYTTYWSKVKRLPSSIKPIGISMFPPKGTSAEKLIELAPSADLLKAAKSGIITKDEYSAVFKEQLKLLCANDIVNSIRSIAGTGDAAIVCYEKPGDFCHRHLVADWLKEELSMTLSELSYKLWIDDQCWDKDLPERHAPSGFVALDSVKSAQEWVEKFGMPEFLDLDHDLGEIDGRPSTVMEFLNWLFNRFPESKPPAFSVHSQNPVGKENITSFLKSWKRAAEMV